MTDITELMKQLTEDTWTKGVMIDRTGRTCLVGRYMICAGLNLSDLDLIDRLNKSDYLFQLHKVIAEQYPEVVDGWLASNDDDYACHELDITGLITYFNDLTDTRYEDIQKVTGKIW